MRRRLLCCSLVAVGSLVIAPALLAQQSGHAGSAAAPHASDGAHFNPPRSFAPPSAPAVRHPVKRPDEHPNGPHHGGGSERVPYVSGAYPGPVSSGYGYPFAYGLVNTGPGITDEDNVTAGPAAAPTDMVPAAVPPGEAGPSGDAVAQPAQQFAETTTPAFRPFYQGSAPAILSVKAQPVTRLIFKDGRAPQIVHNYALTSTTLYALDGDARQEIPLSLLDVKATVETNRAAGVDFALPVSR